MKDSDYQNIIEVTNVSNGFIPYNEKAVELNEQTKPEKVLAFKEVTPRDIKMHRAYMSFIGYVYDYLTPGFKNDVPKKNFYKWLKHLKGNYKVVYVFKGLPPMIEYDSISFTKMSNEQFNEYVKDQLPYIFDVIRKLYEPEKANDIIDTIEMDYIKFLIKL